MMPIWLVVLAVGLVTAGLVDATKLLRRPSHPPKALLALCFSVILSALLCPQSWYGRLGITIWLAGWGLSRVVHSLTSAAQARKDRDRLEVLKNRPGRPT